MKQIISIEECDRIGGIIRPAIPFAFREHATEFTGAMAHELGYAPPLMGSVLTQAIYDLDRGLSKDKDEALNSILRKAATAIGDERLSEAAKEREEAAVALAEATARKATVDHRLSSENAHRSMSVRIDAERATKQEFWNRDWNAEEAAAIKEIRQLAPQAESNAKKKAWLRHHIEILNQVRIFREISKT